MAIDLQPSNFDDFRRAVSSGNVIAVVRTLPADLLTPVGAFLRIARDEQFSFLLESVEGGASVARYTFLGARPHSIARARGRQTIVTKDDGACETLDKPIDLFLREHFAARKLALRPGLPPLAGGAIGFFAYEAAGLFDSALARFVDETIGEASANELATLMFFRHILAFDHVRQLLHVTAIVEVKDANDVKTLRRSYEAAVEETARLEDLLSNKNHDVSDKETCCVVAAPPLDALKKIHFTSRWTRDEFEGGVRAIKEAIARGQCYQAVLSQRFSSEINVAPFEIYRALRRTNPAPYMYFLKLEEQHIIGASPEMLVRVRGDKLEYRPIAGTRPRGFDAHGEIDEREDERLSREMRADAKERAEHIMLVDLGRNDLGRIAKTGSVCVEELMSVERYAHVQHLVSSLRAELDESSDRFDAFAACFPAGTVSGAPKISAMEIVRALEPHPRAVYAGAICYVDYAGNLDSCIAIRTLVIENGTADVQAGAGIVADSVPALEYEETVTKARALVRAVEVAESVYHQER